MRLFPLAVYDKEDAVIKRLFSEAPKHLQPKGRLYLVFSDLAELLGLRQKNFIETMCQQHNLEIIEQREAKLSAKRHSNKKNANAHNNTTPEPQKAQSIVSTTTEEARANAKTIVYVIQSRNT